MTQARFGEERLGELLGLLSPVPEGWVRAAQELPAARRAIDEIVARAEADQRFRQELVSDLEEALRRAGYSPEPRVVETVRRRLSHN